VWEGMEFDVRFEVIRSAERSLAEFTWVGILLGMCSFVSFEMFLADKFLGAALEGALFVCKLNTTDVVGQEELPSGSLDRPSGLAGRKCSFEFFFGGT
jgi:hypothetical protein